MRVRFVASLCCLVLSLLALGAGKVRAQEPEDPAVAPARPAPPVIETWEYVAFPTALAVSLGLKLVVERGAPNWYAQSSFELDILDALSVDSEGARLAWVRVGDIFYIGGVAYGLVAPYVAAAIRDDWDGAGRMGFVHAETLALSATVVFGLQMVIRRVRPNATGCRDDSADTECGTADRESFPGGHTTMATALAGLACFHDPRMDLFRSDAAELALCGVSVAGMIVTTMSRLITENHHPVDQMAGLGIGALIGIGLPYLLHPEMGDSRADRTHGGPAVVVLPTLGRHGAGLVASGPM